MIIYLFIFFFFNNSRISRSNREQYREPLYTVRRNGNTIICIRSPGISGQINPRKKSQIHRPPLTEPFFVLAISIPVEHSLPRSIHNRFTGKQFLGRKDDRFPGPEAATSLPRTQGRRNGIENGWNGENSQLSFPKIILV